MPRHFLQYNFKLADADLELRQVAGTPVAELRTERVFLEPAIAADAMKALPGGQGVLTYLVNEIGLNGRGTPYSMVTATDAARGVPKLADDEIAINAWLAEDLGARTGDSLALRYFVAGEGRELREQTRRFRVRAILPLEHADADWMPPFPGLADVDNCRDWEPGIPIDTKQIRPKDEAYWHQYRGTPKAFISLRAGQAAWSNRFGNLTAIRFPLSASRTLDQAKEALRRGIDPAHAGLILQPVQETALKAGKESEDFGQLFIGFSFFLIVAALLLMAMLFVFNLEQRAEETGLLLALGFTPARARRLLLWEGAVVATCGTLAGLAAGSGYAWLALSGLGTVWKAAVNLTQFHFHAEPGTLLIGAGASLASAWLATWLAGRGQTRRTAARLLGSGAEGEADISDQGSRTNAVKETREACTTRMNAPLALVVCPIKAWTSHLWDTPLAGFAAIAAVAVLIFAGRSAGAFFGAGTLLLIAGIAVSRLVLQRLGGGSSTAVGNTGTAPTVASGAPATLALALRGAARRPGRSLTVVAVLASGIFMVVSVNAFRADPMEHARDRASGTGGFTLFGQSTLPIYEDLDSEPARRNYGLSNDAMAGVHCVSMRLREGDGWRNSRRLRTVTCRFSKHWAGWVCCWEARVSAWLCCGTWQSEEANWRCCRRSDFRAPHCAAW